MLRIEALFKNGVKRFIVTKDGEKLVEFGKLREAQFYCDWAKELNPEWEVSDSIYDCL